eukprot:TRINITY_DN32377_c0_g1_i2.p1 TRINITY_DN32377_c0_g1~~TRINITY_DN32377_c0_g1_i2.p1  ORF type:complete len:210 (+),score=22.67 TRINITY_DN32377_c0_g1_i2:424-1053(+)
MHAEFVFVWYRDLIYYLFYRFVLTELNSYSQCMQVAAYNLVSVVIAEGVRFVPWVFQAEWWIRVRAHRCLSFGIPHGCSTSDETRVKLLHRYTVFAGLRLASDLIASSIVLLAAVLISNVDYFWVSFKTPYNNQQHEGRSLTLLELNICFDILLTATVAVGFAFVHEIRVFHIWARVLFENRAQCIAFLLITAHVATDGLLLFYSAVYV